MSRRYELFQFRKYQNPWKRACSTKNSRKEIWTGSLIGHTLLSIFRISFVRDRIFSPFDSRLILICEKSVLPFFFFFFFVCFKLRLEVFIWIERYFVIFKWRNRVNNRRDNGADMSTCKLREIHSHVRAKHESFGSLHPWGWSGWSFTIIVSFSRSSYLRLWGFVLFSKSKENRHSQR